MARDEWSKKDRKKLKELRQAVYDAGDRRDWDGTDRAEKELDKFKEEMRLKYGKKGI